MDEVVHINAMTVTLFGGLLTILLGIIAFFLSRLIGQFDDLRKEFASLNNTMGRIDKDLSRDVGVLNSRVAALDDAWDRIREIESAVQSIQVGGCAIQKTRCGQ